MGKVIHWELCKKSKFGFMNKLYMHNPESILENETHKIFWDFEIQTHHIISGRRPDLVIVKKKKKKKKKEEKKRTCQIVDFAVPVDHRVKLKESKKRVKCLDLARELKNMEHEEDGDTNYNWCVRNNPQRLDKMIERLGNQRTRGDHINYCIILRSTRKLRRVLDTWGDSNSRENPSVNVSLKNS